MMGLGTGTRPSDDTKIQEQGAALLFSSTDDYSGDDKYASLLARLEGTSAGISVAAPSSTGGAPTSRVLAPGGKIQIRAALRSCKNAVDRALENYKDVLERSNAIYKLQEILKELWEWRNGREDQFGELVNHIHLMLLEVEPEDLSLEQIQALEHTCHTMYYVPRLTDPDLRDIEHRLEKAGFDVFRGVR